VRAALLLFALALTGLLAWLMLSDIPFGGRSERKAGDSELRADEESRSRGRGSRQSATAQAAEAETQDTGYWIEGSVLGPGGQPLPRGEVSKLRPRPIEVEFANDEGRYRIKLPGPGRYYFDAAYGDEFRAVREVVIVRARVTKHDFKLLPLGAVWGTVFCRDQPRERVLVTVFDGETEVTSTESEIGGIVQFVDDIPTNRPLRLTATGADIGYLDPPREFTFDGSPLDLGRIELTPLAELTVTLVLPDGSEASYLTLYHRTAQGELEGFSGPTWRTMPGAFELDIVDNTSGKSVRAKFRMGRGEKLHSRIQIAKGPVFFSGRVVDELGRPREGVEFTLSDKTRAQTDGGGRFRIRFPHSGLHTVQITGVRHPSVGRVRLNEALEVNVDGPELEYVLDLRSRLIVRQRASVMRVRGTRSHQRRMISDAKDGEWRCTSRLQPGPYVIRFGAYYRGIEMSGMTFTRWSEVARIEVDVVADAPVFVK